MKEVSRSGRSGELLTLSDGKSQQNGLNGSVADIKGCEKSAKVVEEEQC